MFGSLNTYTSVLDPAKETMSVSILGTGDFGRSLASRLAEAGAEVRLGTRDINNVRCEVGPGVDIVTNKVAMREGRVVILAIPGQFQKSLAGMSELRPGTVVVDCGNRFFQKSLFCGLLSAGLRLKVFLCGEHSEAQWPVENGGESHGKS